MTLSPPMIAATLGPACKSKETLCAMIEAGARAFRLNFSQNDLDGHQVMLDTLREASDSIDIPVIVMGDLCGPRFRIGPLAAQQILLEKDQRVSIHSQDRPGTAESFGTNYNHFVDDVHQEDRVFIDEGRIVLQVLNKDEEGVECRVLTGGLVRAGKGMNLPDTAISIPPLTDQDWTCVDWVCQNQIDWLLQSFVHHSEDVLALKKGLQDRGGDISVVAKIETLQATRNLDSIAIAADQLLIARGDLGVEIGTAQVPLCQKLITRKGQTQNKPVILATHLLHSMIDHPEPTRAEVSDVANAVIDGVNVLLLTGETAVGTHPVQTVQQLQQIIAATCDDYIL